LFRDSFINFVISALILLFRRRFSIDQLKLVFTLAHEKVFEIWHLELQWVLTIFLLLVKLVDDIFLKNVLNEFLRVIFQDLFLGMEDCLVWVFPRGIWILEITHVIILDSVVRKDTWRSLRSFVTKLKRLKECFLQFNVLLVNQILMINLKLDPTFLVEIF